MTPQQVSTASTTNKRITYFLGVNVRLQSDDFRMISILNAAVNFIPVVDLWYRTNVHNNANKR